MTIRINRVGVIGAGVMGSGIAAHLASAGYDVLLVDIVGRDAPDAVPADHADFATVQAARNAIAAAGLDRAKKLKPATFQRKTDAKRIQLGNLTDDLADLGSCDWIVEAVVERLDIKQKVFASLDEVRGEHTIISSNTSGIPLAAMAEGRSEGFRKHFLITHFFNPVRYMKLLEIVEGQDTDPAVTERMARFCSDALGKGVVFGKDTVNFIANRIGVHGMMVALEAWLQDGYSITEIDAICGEALARPKSAVFRLADVVGLDTLGHVAKNCFDNLTADPERERFALPDKMQALIDRGATGQKAGAGFYKKVGRTISVLDLETMDYVEADRPRFEAVGAARKVAEPGARIAKMVSFDDRAGQLAWQAVSASLVYAANLLGEIADDVASVDRAMRWGFNWGAGPFETWDAIGVQTVADRLKAEGREVPQLVVDMLAAGQTSFYGGSPGAQTQLNAGRDTVPVPALPGIHLDAVQATTKPVFTNQSGDLLDIGEGVLCLRFDTKMNALDDGVIELGERALDWLADGTWDGLVIANDGPNFSVGANLMMIAGAIQAGMWTELEALIARFQRLCQRMKYSDQPVVAAPHQMALGGGCEIAMHCSRTQAAAETYMGLVEVGVGLIPGAGGTKEMTVRALGGVRPDSHIDATTALQPYFQQIATAQVAKGAGEALEMGYLRQTDAISIDGDRRIGDARRVVLQLLENGYRAPTPLTVKLPGAEGLSRFDMALYSFRMGGMASEHDAVIGHQLAKVMCGGERGGLTTEDQLLDLEREAFLHLCGLEKTQARIQHMLQKGKPLRN